MSVTEQRRESSSEAERRVRNYMLDDEEISYSLRFRPTGFVNWLKSRLGYGVTHWFVTNQRVIQETRVSGGFTFKDVPHEKISSIEYGSSVSIPLIVAGAVLGLLGLFAMTQGPGAGFIVLLVALGIIGFAYWRQQQVLAVHASGGVSLALAISKGKQVDEVLWYLHAERNKDVH